MASFERSILRAAKLFDKKNDIKDYVVLKIQPSNGGCCCFHCWPETWSKINEYIRPNGPIADEGDVLIRKGESSFVLECHESGPEIIIYLGLGAAVLNLSKSILDLIVFVLKALSKEKTSLNKIKIIERKWTNSRTTVSERIIEVDLPLKDTLKMDELFRNFPDIKK